MARQIFACLGILFDLIIFLAIGTMALAYIRKPNQVQNLDDWLLFLLPPFAAVLAIAVSVVVYFLRARYAPLRGAIWGLFTATQLFLGLLAYHVLTRHDLIAADGTAYWGKLYLPTLLIGVPISALGIALGAVVGLAIDHLRGHYVSDT